MIESTSRIATLLLAAASFGVTAPAAAGVLTVFIDGDERAVNLPNRGQAGRAAWTKAVADRGGAIKTDDFNGAKIDVPVDKATKVGNFSVFGYANMSNLFKDGLSQNRQPVDFSTFSVGVYLSSF